MLPLNLNSMQLYIHILILSISKEHFFKLFSIYGIVAIVTAFAFVAEQTFLLAVLMSFLIAIYASIRFLMGIFHFLLTISFSTKCFRKLSFMGSCLLHIWVFFNENEKRTHFRTSKNETSR